MTGEAAFEYSEFYDFPDSDEEMDEIEDGNVGELVTSSGAVLGHRSLWRYYKQSFDPRMALVPSKRARQINSFRFFLIFTKIGKQRWKLNREN